MRHHPLSAIAHALDAFDGEIEAFRKDVHEGMHEAMFDPEAMIRVKGPDDYHGGPGCDDDYDDHYDGDGHDGG